MRRLLDGRARLGAVTTSILLAGVCVAAGVVGIPGKVEAPRRWAVAGGLADAARSPSGPRPATRVGPHGVSQASYPLQRSTAERASWPPRYRRLAPVPDSLRRTVAAVTPAVVQVRIWADTNDQSPETSATAAGKGRGAPSRHRPGFVVDGRGYVLTSDEAVRGARMIEVQLPDGDTLRARLAARDRRVGVAVLKVDAVRLPTIALGDSRDLAAGEPVLVIPDGSGPGGAWAEGTLRGADTTRDVLVVDLETGPVRAGGPVLDRAGRVVGVVTGAASGPDRNHVIAVPINRLKPTVRSLMAAAPTVASASER
jgi:S1-C subfamily serine protease